MKLSHVLAVALLAAPSFAQTPPAPAVPPEIPSAPKPRELVGSDGKPLVAGKLPEDASAEARAAWQKTLAASVLSGEQRPPISAFSFDIDAEFKANVERVNQVNGTFEFLAGPGFLRTRFVETGREHVRGPDGDFLIDPKGGGAIKLTNSRDDADDIKQMNDAVVVARNFLALTNPSTLRIARLALLPAAPAGIPKSFAERAKALSWLEVHSPDFRLSRSIGAGGAAGANALYRVQLGLDPKSSLPVLALIYDAAPDANASAKLGPGTLFLELRDWITESGYKLPKQIDTFEMETANASAPLAFRREPTTSIVLKRARINPPLTADSFRPPKK